MVLSNEEATCVVSTFRKIVTVCLAHRLGSGAHLVGDLGAIRRSVVELAGLRCA